MGLLLALWRQSNWRPRTLSQQDVRGLEFSPNGKWLAAGNMESTTAVWNVQTRRQLFNLAGSVVFSPHDMVAVSDWNRTFALWDLQTEQPVRSAQGQEAQSKYRLWHSQRVKTASLSLPERPGNYMVATWPDGKMLACGRGNGQTLQLCDARTGKLLRVLREHEGPADPIAFSQDKSTVASYGYDRGGERTAKVVRVWNVNDGKLLRQVEARPGRYGLGGIALSPDGRILAVGSGGEISLWTIK
jgi:WD40 repeat protein